MKAIGISLLVVIGFVLLGAVGTALNLITIPWLKFNSQVQMNRDIVTKTYTADNALYNYHWFKERATAITALQAKIDIAQKSQLDFDTSAGPRSSWSFEDKNEDSRLRTVVLGLQAQYQDITAEYNARAQEADRNIFSTDLPLFFNLKAY